MEGVLSFLELAALAGVGIFALYQTFEIGDSGVLARPVPGWTARACLIAIAAVCFFTVARLAATR
jgi:hypothetical protein